MGDLGFDETYNIREAIDFLTDKMGVREKLIQSAKQFSEKNGSAKFGVTVKRFEELYADFLRLYQPVFERIAGHKDALQNEIDSKKDALTGVVGMIQVAKGVEVLADRLRELEIEAKGIEASINDKEATMEKIDQLLSKIKHPGNEIPRPGREEESSIFGESEDFLISSRETPTKAAPTRKTSTR